MNQPSVGSGFTRGLTSERRGQVHQYESVPGAYILNLNNVAFFDDFLTDTLPTDWYAAATEADGTDQTAVAITEAASGTITISLGSAANDFGVLASPIVYQSGKSGRLDVRVKVTDGANALDSIFIGLSDAKTESNGVVVSNAATPTIVATDAIGFAYDLANGGDAWYGVAAKNGTDTSVELGVAPTAEYQTLRMEWSGNGYVVFYVDGVVQGTLSDAYDNDHNLCILIAASHVGGTGDPVLTVDFVSFVQER